MSNKVVLLEFVDEAKLYLDFCQQNELDIGKFRIFALNPRVQVFLKKKDIGYEDTQKYFNNQSHERCLLKSEELYQLIEQTLHLRDTTEIYEGYNNYVLFHTRLYINHLLYLIELLSNIIDKNGISELYCCVQKIPFEGTVTITDNDRHLGLIAKKIAEKKGITFNEIPSPTLQQNKHCKNEVQKILFFKPILKLINEIKLQRLLKKDIILLTTTGYNFDLLSKSIKKRLNNVSIIENYTTDISFKMYVYNLFQSFIDQNYTYKIFTQLYYPDPIDVKGINEELNLEFDSFLNKMNDISDDFSLNGINFYTHLTNKLKFGLWYGLNDLQIQTSIVNNLLDKLKPKLIISPYSREINRNIAELGNAKNIPSICISHGSLVKPKNKFEKIDHYHIGLSLILNEYRYHCIQSPLAQEYLEYYDVKGKTIKTGNLIFSKTQDYYRNKIREGLLGKQHNDYKIILHGNTLKPRGVHFHWVETFDEYISGLVDLVKVVDQMDKVHLIIKLHPIAEITEEDLRLFLPASENYSINKKERFWHVLSVADMLISFGSTAIEDALQNKIPVLLYDKWGRYKHCEAEELYNDCNPQVSPVYYLKDEDYLFESLNWLLSNKEKIPDDDLGKYVYTKNGIDAFIELLKSLLKPNNVAKQR